MLAMGLVLLLIIKDAIFQETCRKGKVLISLGTSSFKIIFVLLTKIVIFQVQMLIV